MKKLFGILPAIGMILSVGKSAAAEDGDYTTGTPWPLIDLNH